MGPIELLAPTRLWSRDEVLARPCPVPREPGVYAWYFRQIPPSVPTDGCIRCGPYTLLYLGIAPKAPPTNGAASSRQRLSHRVRYHYRGNAEGSTLRLTLGCLLAADLGLEFRRVGTGKRLTFAAGEAALSAWMGANAFVSWLADPTPWKLEARLIRDLCLPPNLDQNDGHPFQTTLTEVRRRARARARELPVLSRR